MIEATGGRLPSRVPLVQSRVKAVFKAMAAFVKTSTGIEAIRHPDTLTNPPIPTAAGTRGSVVPREVILMVTTGEDVDRPIAQALEAAGYDVVVAQGIHGAVENLGHSQPSLIVIGCPATPAACRALRQTTSVPILAMLPASTGAEMVACLDAGADDCQWAWITDVEVLLRVRALLRRQRQMVGAEHRDYTRKE